jgi:hypothetical protein
MRLCSLQIQRHILLTYRNISYLEDEKRKRAELASLDQAKSAFLHFQAQGSTAASDVALVFLFL